MQNNQKLILSFSITRGKFLKCINNMPTYSPIIPNNKICIEARPNMPIISGAIPKLKEFQKINL